MFYLRLDTKTSYNIFKGVFNREYKIPHRTVLILHLPKWNGNPVTTVDESLIALVSVVTINWPELANFLSLF